MPWHRGKRLVIFWCISLPLFFFAFSPYWLLALHLDTLFPLLTWQSGIFQCHEQLGNSALKAASLCVCDGSCLPPPWEDLPLPRSRWLRWALPVTGPSPDGRVARNVSRAHQILFPRPPSSTDHRHLTEEEPKETRTRIPTTKRLPLWDGVTNDFLNALLWWGSFALQSEYRDKWRKWWLWKSSYWPRLRGPLRPIIRSFNSVTNSWFWLNYSRIFFPPYCL